MDDSELLFEPDFGLDSEDDSPGNASCDTEKPAAPSTSPCPFCHKDIPSGTMDTHMPGCRGRNYLGRVAHTLKGDGCLTTLSKLAKHEVDLPYVYDNGTDDVARDIALPERFLEVAVGATAADGACDSILTQDVVDAIRERAAEGGMRTEDRFEKHVRQEVALCGQIAQMIRESHPEVYDRAVASPTRDATADVCIIDCGAAAGELLHLFQALFKTTVVNVEFYEPVRMVDAHYEGDPNFLRLWKRVEDVTAADLAPMRRTVNIVVAKHLCGDSTDAAMGCVVDKWRSFFPVTHFVAAPCCQQMSTWEKYLGTPFLKETYGLCKEDFEVIRNKTGWKSLKHRASKERHRHLYDIAKIYEAAWHAGRVDFLKRTGADVNVFQFVPEDVTIKNVAITARFAC